MSERRLLYPVPDRQTVSRRRLLALSVSVAGIVAASAVTHLPATFPPPEDTLDASRSRRLDAIIAGLEPRVVDAARKKDWFRRIDDPHLRLLEWLVAGHRNTGGLGISAPALGSTFGHADIPIVTAGMFDVERQLDVIDRDMFLFLGGRPVIFSSDTPLSSNDLDSVKKLVTRWFPQAEEALGIAYPFTGTHVQLNVANSHGRATTRGANIWLAPDFSNLPYAFIHERVHSYQYDPQGRVRFPVFTSEGSAESIATLLTSTPSMWRGDGEKVDLELRGLSPGGGPAYAEQSYNGYQFFADLLRIMGKAAFLDGIQRVYAGTQQRSGAEVIEILRDAAPNAYAVDALSLRAVQDYRPTDVAPCFDPAPIYTDSSIHGPAVEVRNRRLGDQPAICP